MSQGEVMQGLDIPFPHSEYEVLTTLKGFSLIYPSDHPLAQIVKINMMIRAVAFDDEEYQALVMKEVEPQELSPVGGRLFEISYIRECPVRNVASFEWQRHYGPDSLSSYLRATKSDEDSYVKVISLKYPDYSLNVFNQRYGKSVRSQ